MPEPGSIRPAFSNPKSALSHLISVSSAQADSVGVCDVAELCNSLLAWRTQFPSLSAWCSLHSLPCNGVAEVLAGCGAVLRARNRIELTAAVNAGVPSDSILLDNPCKTKSLINYARRIGVGVTAFDSEQELAKLAANWPEARLMLTLRVAPADGGDNELGAVGDNNCYQLLNMAKCLGMSVIGVSFAMSDSADFDAWLAAFDSARSTLEEAAKLGMSECTRLDVGRVGGGTTARVGTEFDYLQSTVMSAFSVQFTDWYLPPPSVSCDPAVSLLNGGVALATKIIDVRQTGESDYQYRLGDSVYSAFNSLWYGGVRPNLCGLLTSDGAEFNACGPAHRSQLIGATGESGDSLDGIVGSLPRLSVGDWLVWSGLGFACGSTSAEVNEIERPEFHCCVTNARQQRVAGVSRSRTSSCSSECIEADYEACWKRQVCLAQT